MWQNPREKNEPKGDPVNSEIHERVRLDVVQEPLDGDERNNSRHDCSHRKQRPVLVPASFQFLQNLVSARRQQRRDPDKERELGGRNPAGRPRASSAWAWR